MTRSALALCVVLAWAVARRVPSRRQRAIAATLTGLLALDVARPTLRPWLVLDLAAFAGWYAATAWGVWAVLQKDESPGLPPEAVTPARSLLDGGAHLDRRSGGLVSSAATPTPKPTIPSDRERSGVMITALACIASAAFAVRLGYVAELPRAAFALALAVQILAGIRSVVRGGWPARDDRAAWISAWVLVCSSVADLAGPWLFAQPVRDWYISRWISVATWVVIGGVNLWMLLTRRTVSPSR